MNGETMEKVRFGMIGCGTVACYGHLPALTSTPEVELVAVSDLSEARLAEVKEKYNLGATYPD